MALVSISYTKLRTKYNNIKYVEMNTTWRSNDKYYSAIKHNK